MKRVEIENQFDPSNPWISFMAVRRGPCRVNREQVGTVHDQPSNWREFCDEVDATLEKLSKTKRMYNIVSFLTLVLVAFLILAQFFFRSIVKYAYSGEDKKDEGVSWITFMIFPVVIFIFVSASIAVYCLIYSNLNKTFKEVSSICSRYSVPNVVSYQLRDEWWGGCSKYNSRRRFLIVTVENREDVVEQQHQEVPEQLADNVKPETFDDNQNAGNGSSLFNQLASGMK